MSSSNEVRIAYIKESVYAETPVAGNFSTARFTSESVSATPETTESAQIRTDRLSSGQVLTGLTVGGGLEVEFAKASDIDDLFEGAMMSTWATTAPVVEDFDIDVTAKTLTRGAGDWNGEVALGQLVTLAGFAAVNNVPVMITEIVSATVVKFIGEDTMVTEVGSGTSFTVNDEVGIGTTRNSYSVEKKFNDLTNKGIVYKGAYVDGFQLTAAYGDIVKGSFNFAAATYTPVDAAVDFITNARAVDAPATSTSLNGSVDMAFLASSDSGTFEGVNFCIQSIDITLANNLQAQNCIGKVGPDNYTLGQASVSISMSAYLSDDSWGLLAKKLSQESFSLGFILKNSGGHYGFFMPAIQVSFDDPSSGGQNTDIILSMQGVAKVGDSSEKSLYIYKSA